MSQQIKYVYIVLCKCANRSRGQPKCSLFNSYYTEVFGWRYEIASFPFNPCLIILRVKQRGIKYHVLSRWYDSTRDLRTPYPLYQWLGIVLCISNIKKGTKRKKAFYSLHYHSA